MFIRRDFAAFCERSDIDSKELLRVSAAIQKDTWLAGGAVRRTLIGHSVDSDFDFFFRSEEHKDAWLGSLPNTLVQEKKTEHHTQLRGKVEGSDLPIVVQAIHFAYYASAEAVIDSFDYTITQFCLDPTKPGDDIDPFAELQTLPTPPLALVTTENALWDLGRRKLALNKVTYAVPTMRRMIKYTSQGFTACSGCMAQLLRETASSEKLQTEIGKFQYID